MNFKPDNMQFSPDAPPLAPDDFGPVSDIETRKLAVTFFEDQAAQSQRCVQLTLPQLAECIRYATADDKMRLPWLKLAIFGSKRTENNCLRSNENVEQVGGLEGDHDSGEMSFDEAVERIRKAKIRALLYTSASHVPGIRERWRILVPLSQNRKDDVRGTLRAGYVARVNGLLNGKLANESFTLSQAFLYGHLEGAEYRVEIIDGDFIDRRDDTFAGRIFKNGSPGGDRPAGGEAGAGPERKSRNGEEYEPASRQRIEAALEVVSSDCNYLEVWMPVGGALWRELGASGGPIFHQWSARAKHRYNYDACEKAWRGFSTLREFTGATIFSLADQADPGWRRRYHDAERQRFIDGMGLFRNGPLGGTKPEQGDEQQGGQSAGTGEKPETDEQAPPLIQAKPFVLRDPKTLTKRQWVYGKHLIRKFASATFAPSGSGKTNTFIAEALAMATGRDLLGIMPPKRARVWLWNGEDPYDELERRVGAACLHYGIAAEELDGWLFINSGRDPHSKIIIATETRNGTTIAAPVVDALVTTIRANKIDVVIIDPFISSHQVSENDNNAIDAVAKTFSAIADITDTAIDLGHHTRKTGGAEVTVEDGRGAVALLNAVRPARALNVMTEDEATKAGVLDGRRRYFRITDGKNNLSLPVDKMAWFRSASVDLGNGDPADMLDNGDQVGVVTAWEWPNPMDGVTGVDFDKAAAAIRAGQWRLNNQAKAWVGHAVAKALGLGDVRKKSPQRAKVIGMVSTWIHTGALVVVERLDPVQRREKEFVEVAPDPEDGD